MYQTIKYIALCCVVLAMSSCGGGGGGSDSPSGNPSSGSGNSNVGAPDSIIGSTLVETIAHSGYKASNGGSINISGPGETLEYSFKDRNTILGKGLNVVNTISWNYRLTGNTAVVDQYLQYGETHDELVFTSPTKGTFKSTGTLISGTTFWFDGTFTIKDFNGGGTGNASSSSSTSNTSSTGRVSFWTSLKTANVSVVIDGVPSGTLTSYFTGTPTCGQAGTITKTLSSGSHSYSASDATGTWGPSTFNITSDSCLLYELH